MRRITVSVAFAGLLVLGGVVPAVACHFGGLGCNQPPENQPFNPQPSITLDDNRTSANSASTVKITQQAHEQFPAKLVIDFPAEVGVDLDVPAFNEKIADLTIRAIISGASTTLNGRILDHNEPGNALHGHPTADGVYHWIVEIDSSTPGSPPSRVDSFADKRDGHFHFVFEASADLIATAITVDASLQELTTKFFGSVAGGPFLTNPAVAGTYTATFTFTGWDDPATPETPPTVTRNASFTIADRVPTTVTLAPATATLRVGATHTLTATVKDQRGDALAGALVDFDVTGGPHAGNKCDDVATNASGVATCSYSEGTGSAANQSDPLRATATKFGTSASATASVKWRAPSSVTLSPTSQTKRVGETASVTATVRDQDAVAMSGETVVFNRTGANPGSQNTTSNGGGIATHTYTGNTAGNDSITATVPGFVTSSPATATFYVPAATSLSLTPGSATRTVNQQHTVTATVLDQHGRAMQGVAVDLAVTDGPNTGASGAGTTNASGQTSFSYTGGSGTGTDTITATAGSLSATAQVTWQQQNNPQDSDGDGIVNTQDNCWNVPNPDQADNDGDGFGDACDSDDDNDSLQDTEEAPNGCNAFVKDTDGDGLNDWQEVKGYKTKCNDPDTDDDGLNDYNEIFGTGTSPTNPDHDGDGVKDGADNCPRVANADQRDSNGDGIGDACQPGVRICVNGVCPVTPARGRLLPA